MTTDKPDGDYDTMAEDAVHLMRECAKKGLGFNCTFVDDDMKVLVGLAQRAVLAGLASDFDGDMQERFSKAAEPFRADHEKALDRSLSPPAPQPSAREALESAAVEIERLRALAKRDVADAEARMSAFETATARERANALDNAASILRQRASALPAETGEE